MPVFQFVFEDVYDQAVIRVFCFMVLEFLEQRDVPFCFMMHIYFFVPIPFIILL